MTHQTKTLGKPVLIIFCWLAAFSILGCDRQQAANESVVNAEERQDILSRQVQEATRLGQLRRSNMNDSDRMMAADIENRIYRVEFLQNFEEFEGSGRWLFSSSGSIAQDSIGIWWVDNSKLCIIPTSQVQHVELSLSVVVCRQIEFDSQRHVTGIEDFRSRMQSVVRVSRNQDLLKDVR